MKGVKQKEYRSYNLNFGPQHPAAHGVLRLMVTLKGEKNRESDSSHRIIT